MSEAGEHRAGRDDGGGFFARFAHLGDEQQREAIVQNDQAQRAEIAPFLSDEDRRGLDLLKRIVLLVRRQGEELSAALTRAKDATTDSAVLHAVASRQKALGDLRLALDARTRDVLGAVEEFERGGPSPVTFEVLELLVDLVCSRVDVIAGPIRAKRDALRSVQGLGGARR